MKISLISSTGGHWTQLNEIIKLFQEKSNENIDLHIVTEKNQITESRRNISFLAQQDRKNKFFIFIFIWNIVLSLKYVLIQRPDYVISTGAGVVLPYLLIAKLLKAKIIYIESFAKTKSPTITGKIVYKFADRFFVQWPNMLKCYPKAEYRGSLY
ncbi:PssD/Cps14F family polysaccharide biosynthesis glycosyltransferase [Neobacillus cucumis]|uniref:PssD/Cps14F family polysaccharide biosynthesis glycosyltransferase n=1 Tax=Neobacillus cucumis TaxID=1740721 RepID=UPI002E211192|nr:PssD/Cps14F family polysaccharide biosynthesis glycosyltransferase [Neobacillus cucumis]MED4224255.1 PssD/Cps14F family polysaccharide biosynthesis glycosyltransferase [Neobacillus cucumis]